MEDDGAMSSSSEMDEDDNADEESFRDKRVPWVTRFRSLDPRRKPKKIKLKRRKIAPKSFLWKPIKSLIILLVYKIPYLNRYLPDRSKANRIIHLDGSGAMPVTGDSAEDGEEPRRRFRNNSISTTKYGPITFIPINLYEQFKRLANFWFLTVAILQLIPSISPLNPASSLLPLGFVLLVTAFKEAFEDIKRRISDRKLNRQKTMVWRDGQFVSKQWRKVKVGNLLKLHNNESVPADVVILNTSNTDGICYVETANLDGESNLKVRQALEVTIDALQRAEDLGEWNATITCEAPNPELYTFKATIDTQETALPLTLDQTLWRGCTLRNTEWAYAAVVYTGMDTKIMKNARNTPHKRSTVEKDMNLSIFTVFVFMMWMNFLGGLAGGIWANLYGYDQTYLELHKIESSAVVVGFQSFAANLILIHTMIPISLYVYMEMLKVVMAWRIECDVEMYHKETNTPAKANTSNLAEELGQIEYVFSDKTGTLTSNTMFFKRCNIQGKSFGDNPVASDDEDTDQDDTTKLTEEKESIFEDEELLETIKESEVADMFFKILALCHTVIISSHHKLNTGSEEDHSEMESENEESEKEKGEELEEDDAKDEEKQAQGEELAYQAASPDEAALVSAARTLGYAFSGRTNQSIKITVNGEEECWDLLNILEFNSDRKRMSVIVRDPNDGRVKLLCKGADQVIFERLAEGQDDLKSEVFEALGGFASVGLRTLCLAMKVIDDEEYDRWNEKYQEAALLVEGREEAIDDVANEIESGLTLIGATAIEDRLQDGVPAAISMLLKAGIKMWVLTGDKMETAINIGFSCSLLDPAMHRLIFASERVEHHRDLSITNQEEAIIQLERYISHYFPDMKPWKPKDFYLTHEIVASCADLSAMKEADDVMQRKEGEKEDKYALIIDGKALKQYLPPKNEGGFNELSARFLELAMRCKVVICCRVSPGQKALVVDLVKIGLGAKTLAIGDGANDVPMIQAANVGVGISGKEGRQAVNTADYAIAQFRFLVPLLLVHGHWSYRRLCKLVLYSFYKNMLFAMTKFLYGLFCGFSGTSLYESWIVSVFNVFFTGAPILATAIFDQQNSREQLLQYPQLYERGRLSKDFSWGQYWMWLLMGIWESLVIFFFIIAACWQSNFAANGLVLGIGTIGCIMGAGTVLAVNLQVVIITRTWTFFNHVALYLSVLSYFVLIILLSVLPPSVPVVKADLIYFEIFNMMSTAVFWLAPIVATVLAVLPSFVLRYVQRNYFPANYQIIQEVGRIQRKRQRKMRKSGARELKDRFGMRKKSASRPGEEYTGYAFSQSPGAVDMLLSLGLAPVPKGLRAKIMKPKGEATRPQEVEAAKEEGSSSSSEEEDIEDM